MLCYNKQSGKQFWRQALIYVITLGIVIGPCPLGELMAQQHNQKQRLRYIEEYARAVRTYIDPTLAIDQQQKILCRKQLKSCKQALAKIKTGKEAKSLIKDIAALHKKLKTVHIGLQAQLIEMRARLQQKKILSEDS